MAQRKETTSGAGRSSSAPAAPSVSPVAEALYKAAARGKLATVRQLLRGKADPDSKVSKRGAPQSTALLAAALRGRSAVVQTLVREAGASVVEPNANGLTPLLAAITKRDLVITNILLEAKAPVNALSTTGQTPLMVAAALAAAGNAFQGTAHRSSSSGGSGSSGSGSAGSVVPKPSCSLGTVSAGVVDSSADTNEVVTLQNLVETLLAAKADVNQRSAAGRTALVSAVDCGGGGGHGQTAHRPKKKKTSNRTSSDASAVEGTVRRLLEANAQPGDDESTTPAARVLLLSNTTTKTKTAAATTTKRLHVVGECSSVHTVPAAPIWIASSRGDWRVVHLLLKAKADPDGSKYGRAPSHPLPGTGTGGPRKARTALFEVVKSSSPPIDTMQLLLVGTEGDGLLVVCCHSVSKKLSALLLCEFRACMRVGCVVPVEIMSYRMRKLL